MFRLTPIFVILSGFILLLTSQHVQANTDSKYLLLKQLLGLKKVHSSSEAFNPEPEWYRSKSEFHYPGQDQGSSSEESIVTSAPVIGGAGGGDETAQFLGIMLKNYEPYYGSASNQQQQQQQEEVFMFPGQQQPEQPYQGYQGGTTDQSSLYSAIQQQKYRQGTSYSGVTGGGGGSGGGSTGDDYALFSSIQRSGYAPYTQQQQQQQQQGSIYSMSNEDIAQLNSQGYVKAAGGGGGQEQNQRQFTLNQNTNDQTREFLDVMIKNYGPYSGGGGGGSSSGTQGTSQQYGSQFHYPGGY